MSGASTSSTEHPITFREALRVWIKVALLSFGGPAGQIATMHRILIEEKRWISEERFLHALNYCMLLPGPEAQQLAIYIGWLLHKTRGGIAAGVLFVLPGFASILALSVVYAVYREASFVQALFFGLKPAVMAVVAEAVFRIGGRALKNNVMMAIAAAAFVAIFLFNAPFPAIVLSAGILGYFGGKYREDKFHVIRAHQAKSGTGGGEFVISDTFPQHTKPTLSRSIRILGVCLALWFLPLGVLALAFGAASIYVVEGVFFSKTAMVTFGGAYAVLAYIAQQAVGVYGWLRPAEMLDGLGMAETTPGPLIMVVQFVGFMGAYRNPGGLDPVWAGVIGSLITVWVTFVPCFLWIFLGAPYIENLRGNKRLSSALSAITAAVVGVILNLAVWFSLHTVFGEVNEIRALGMRFYAPVWGTLDVASLILAAGAFIAILRYKAGMIKTLAASAAAGLVYFLVFG
ncbi:MAG: chromate efflux transporter [Deltaproteobacteria bacterium]